MLDFILYGTKRINFTLTYSSRKTLGIAVMPDSSVLVKAPFNTALEKIKNKVFSRARWIVKQQTYFGSYYPKKSPRKYISGETHLYLGKQYRLKVIIGKKNETKLKHGILEVHAIHPANIKKLLLKWYIQKAGQYINSHFDKIFVKFKNHKLDPGKIIVKTMAKRWGSCTSKGNIVFNTELIKAPKPCIEYVIIHELCHLIEPSHNTRFYKILKQKMPDWEKWKNKLEKLLA